MREDSPVNDTSAWAERILVEGYRAMSPERKLRQVASFTRATERLALARIRKQYGPLEPREEKLRLAALRLPRETMIRLFNWDPVERGY
jgi:hypothetical protein